jgi:hypothetical protein
MQITVNAWVTTTINWTRVQTANSLTMLHILLAPSPDKQKKEIAPTTRTPSTQGDLLNLSLKIQADQTSKVQTELKFISALPQI